MWCQELHAPSFNTLHPGGKRWEALLSQNSRNVAVLPLAEETFAFQKLVFVLTESLDPWRRFSQSVFAVHRLLRRLKPDPSCWPTQPKGRTTPEADGDLHQVSGLWMMLSGSLTSVPRERSSRTKGITPRMMSTPLLSTKNKAHL